MLSFIAEWFDPQPQLMKRYLLKYYTNTNEIEMKEVCSGRKFLKRTKIDKYSLSRQDFYVGAATCIFSRDLKLVDYGDNATRISLDNQLEKTVAVLTPGMKSSLGKILRTTEEHGLMLVDMKAFKLQKDLITTKQVEALALESNALSVFDEGETSGLYIALELRGKNSLKALSDIASSIRQNEKKEDRFIVSSSTAEVILLRDLFLKRRQKSTATYDITNTTCCIIKPHVIKSRTAGALLDDIISRGFEINAIQLFHLGRTSAAEFYEVYNGAIQEYNSMLDELVSGPILALEVRSNVEKFRKSAGPWDIEMARNLYPDTIRAKFGMDRIRNALHCTDLPEDNTNETSYFFNILNESEQQTSNEQAMSFFD